MTKSIVAASGILILVLVAFWAGRWTAPINEQAHASGILADSVQTGHNNAITEASDLTEQTTASSQKLKAPPKLHRSESYAADSQTLQSLLALAASNPQLAMERAQEFKGPIKIKAESAILEVWAVRDADGAWNWLQSFRPGNTEQFISLLEVIGRSEPRIGLSYAEKFAGAHPEMRKDIYLSAITGVTQSGAYRVATEFLEHLDIDVAIKAELVNVVASAWGVYEPQAAMQWINGQPEELRAGAASRLSGSWADVDPQGATSFAATMQGSENEPALQQSFSKWLATDSAAATAWLASEPKSLTLDPLLNEVATQPDLVNGQVKTALSWAARVSDPELRLNTLIGILSAYKQQDPKAASLYLQEITYLTDAERNRLKEDLVLDN